MGKLRNTLAAATALTAIALALCNPVKGNTPSPVTHPTQTPVTQTATPTETPQPTYTTTPAQPTYTPPAAATPTTPPTPTAPPTIDNTVTPPQSTATPQQTANPAEVKSLIEHLNASGETITDYKTIQPIVEAVFEASGLNYKNLNITVITSTEFDKQYCAIPQNNSPICIDQLANNRNASLAFLRGTNNVVVRGGTLYPTLTATIREGFLGLSFLNHNTVGIRSLEIAGNLGLSFGSHYLAEKFAYTPHLIETEPHKDAIIKRGESFGGFGNPEFSNWWRASWLINLDSGAIDITKPEKELTSSGALLAFTAFNTNPNRDAYVQRLLVENKPEELGMFVATYLLANRTAKGPAGNPIEVLSNNWFYLP